MSALNPNHPVTRAMDGQWHKIAALIMAKAGIRSVVITPADIESLGQGGGTGIAIKDQPDGIHVWLVDQETGAALARKEGGLPT